VAALILALAALSGFQERLLGAVRSSTPALQVELLPEHKAEEVRAAIHRALPDQTMQLLWVGRGWVGGGGRYEVTELIGYESSLPGWLGTALPATVFETRGSAAGSTTSELATSGGGVWLSERLSRRLSLVPGEPVEVVSPRPHLGPRGQQPRARWLEVAGWLESPEVEEAWNERLALPLNVASTLLGQGDRRFDLVVEAAPPAPGRPTSIGDAALGQMARDLETELRASGLENARVFDWRDRNRPLLFVLRLEKAVVFLAVALIVVVASFALLSTLHLLLANKSREVGVLGALGASPASLRRIFRLLGLLLAGTGGVIGGVLGTSLAWILDRFELLRLPGQVYILDHVPFAVRWRDAALVIASALLMTFLASLLGARKAAALSVVEALRR
jgi:lipoprotein-releasing system permease protein